MRVLVIGSGGREHAICSAFARSKRVSRVFCASGNAGIASVAELVGLRADDIASLADFAVQNEIDLTFPGGETSLALGIVDEFQQRGLKIVGPTRAAARLESSKAYAKDFMARYGVPTAKYAVAHSAEFAAAMLESGDFGDPRSPVVVKADGLAAGKGVIVAQNRAEALEAVRDLEDIAGADAASRIVIEECLAGREISLLLFVDGEDFALMPPARDHKRIGEGDTGPNTGGMGTITDDSLLSEPERQEIIETIIRPTLKGCREEGFPYRGILFLGLMMTESGPRVLEYNVRFGDPETQSILVRLKTDFVDICEAIIEGRLGEVQIEWLPGSSACVVLASEGYPFRPRTGDIIHGLEDAAATPNVRLFHAGTAFQSASIGAGGISQPTPPTASAGISSLPAYITAGGRVLGITATGDSLDAALSAAYAAVSKISWPGMQFRRDIGH